VFAADSLLDVWRMVDLDVWQTVRWEVWQEVGWRSGPLANGWRGRFDVVGGVGGVGGGSVGGRLHVVEHSGAVGICGRNLAVAPIDSNGDHLVTTATLDKLEPPQVAVKHNQTGTASVPAASNGQTSRRCSKNNELWRHSPLKVAVGRSVLAGG
jgi:hypothetical protein